MTRGCRHVRGLSIVALSAALSALAPDAMRAQEYSTQQEDTEKVLAPDGLSLYAGRIFPQRPLWGDTHLHTMVSVDAGTRTRLSQEGAFGFTRS